MPIGVRQVINIPPGVNKEDNDLTSFIYTDADKIRFYQGLPEKIGGWLATDANNEQTLTGVPRTLYSYIDNGNVEHLLIGTDRRLYTYENGNLYNITPLVTATTAIANSLATNYVTLGANPIATTDGETVIRVTYAPLANAILREGDIIQISGVVGSIGGVSAATLNASHSISNITATTFDFVISTAATSTATGGTGATLSTRVITVSQIGHGFLDGDRLKIASAANFGGFLAADVNIESWVRSINSSSYAYYLNQTSNFATSSVSSAGGAATTVRGQIAAGRCTIASGFGYGGGLYGRGKYGTGKTFVSGYFLPRIWSIDRYGEKAILTPGNQSGVYEWDGDFRTAPTLVSGAPAAVNYLFVAQAENQVVTFGAGNIGNRIYTSDSGDLTNWTVDATSLAFDRNIEGSAKLISHAYVKGQYLLFTTSGVYTMFFVDKPDVWVVKLLTDADGIIGPHAVAELADSVVWMGQNDFYIYNGSVVSQIPNNTLLHWMIDNMNWPKSYLSFARKVMEFNEVWWFFPRGESDEPDTYIIWNYAEGHFTNGTLTRTAAEKPSNPARAQYMAVGSCDGSIATALYQHEVTFTNDNDDMTGSLSTNYTMVGQGDYIQQISQIIPSNYILPIGELDEGELLYSMIVNTKEYDGQVLSRSFGPYDVFGSTTKIDTRIVGRQRQYVYSFSNQTGFRIQKTYEMQKPFTVR